MKFTDRNIEKAFEQARQALFDQKAYKDKTSMELLLDESFISRLHDLGSAKDLLQHLVNFDDMDWAKNSRELSAQEMADFINSVSYDEAISAWESTDDEWEAKATDSLEWLLSYSYN
ncbi:hypothetical protein [Limosilactobacillus mucosae]|uniref:Uncharacterized protein n=1 Tax=Limosilactobacillus mucosae TaxID=97478 RepID=A0AAJ1HS05_LIMMU|nr:hypothetical protein [Limosilactobacillus mucosae]MDC2828489.1 hypothetical protein [Limosilactobacillus mucosae]MDC2834387.1 hypothetical protein [Limosilactobacillus mucosae]